MASKTIYTSTIRVPVYAGWRCPKCDEILYSEGVIAFRQQAQTFSWNKEEKEATATKASRLAKEGWADEAVRIIGDPRGNAQLVRNELFLNSTKCPKCRKKPKWDKGTAYMASILAFVPAIISGVIAFGLKTNIVAWAVFAVLLVAFLYGFVSEIVYKNMMSTLPLRYTPIIGSFNEELLTCAEKHGVTVHSPSECISILSEYNS